MWAYEGIFYQIYQLDSVAPTKMTANRIPDFKIKGLEQLSGTFRYLFYIIKSNFRIRQSWL